MVKKIVIFFAYLSFFILALLYFTPKVSAYYFLETQLKKYDLIISSETPIDSGLSFNIQNATVVFKSIESAEIENINIKIFGLYNRVRVDNIELSSAVASFVPTKVSSVDISYHIGDPLHINAKVVGEFGTAEAVVDILERSVHLKLLPSAVMSKKYRHTLKNLKKSEDGEFVYDKTF